MKENISSNEIFLVLETDLRTIDGQAPSKFKLQSDKIFVGRGTNYNQVDLFISAKKDGREIISRKHGEIIRNSCGGYTVRDIGALNGIFVNEKRIDVHSLNDGDIIQFGGVAKVPIGTKLKASDTCIKFRYKVLNHEKIVLNDGQMNVETNGKNGIHETPQLRTNLNPLARNPIAVGDVCHSTSSINFQSSKPSAMREISSNVPTVRQGSNIIQDSMSLRHPSDRHDENGRSDGIHSGDESHLQRTYDSKSVPSRRQSQDREDPPLPHPLPTSSLVPARPVFHSNQKSAEHPNTTQLAAPVTVTCVTARDNSDRVPLSLPPASPACSIDVQALRSHLSCPLCGFILLDAAVMPCSHGFCMACIETHITKAFHRSQNSASADQKKNVKLCPVCVDEDSQSQSQSQGRDLGLYRQGEYFNVISYVTIILLFECCMLLSTYIQLVFIYLRSYLCILNAFIPRG